MNLGFLIDTSDRMKKIRDATEKIRQGKALG
jgi:hypothetical protein